MTAVILVTFHHNQNGALEAGFKYLVQSVAGSVLIILGISLVLAQEGTLDMAVLSAVMPGVTSGMLAAGTLFHRGLWGQGGAGADVYLAAGCPFAGPQRG